MLDGNALHFVRGNGTLGVAGASDLTTYTGNVGSSGQPVGNVFATALYGDGSNLTNLPLAVATDPATGYPCVEVSVANLGFTYEPDGDLVSLVHDPVFYALDGGYLNTGMPFIFKNGVGELRFMPFDSGNPTPGPEDLALYIQSSQDNMVLSKKYGGVGQSLTVKFSDTVVYGALHGTPIYRSWLPHPNYNWTIDEYGNFSGTVGTAFGLASGNTGDYTGAAFNDFFGCNNGDLSFDLGDAGYVYGPVGNIFSSGTVTAAAFAGPVNQFSTTAPDSPGPGAVYFDTVAGTVKVFDGDVWKTLAFAI